MGEIAFKHGASTAMTTTKTYDGLNRLTSISSAPAVGGTSSYAYQYNSAGQRDLVTLQNGDTWNYGYNSRGEVTSGGKKQGGSTDLLGHQFGYAYDNIGNRTSSTKSSRTTSYQANSLNQYTGRTVPGYFDVIGEAKTTAIVMVDGTSATRQGTAFYKELSADNSSGPVYLTTTVKGELGSDEAERTGKLYLAPNEEAYTYDKDGNLLSDGRWTYQWNGENRLIGMETQASAATAGVPKKRLTFAYDYQGRRICKKVEDWTSSLYQERYTMLFVYDDWNLIAETLQTGPKIRSYVWGSDLSGGNGAGGVGGLLLIGQYPEEKHYSAGYDGNGNVISLSEMESEGEPKGRYEYGPFGELVRASGPMAVVNRFQFSTKYTDNETGLIYYGYRYYTPLAGRWISRDPLGDNAFFEGYGIGMSARGLAQLREESLSPLYVFSDNNSSNNIDLLGLLSYSGLASKYPTPAKYPTALGKGSIWELIGGKVKENADAGVFTNSCAIRVSYALNKAGVAIPYISGQTSSGSDKQWYIFRVEQMKSFLNSKFGRPTSYKSEKTFKESGCIGIVLFEIQFADATGHVTLWDGSRTIDGRDDYVGQSRAILHWSVDKK